MKRSSCILIVVILLSMLLSACAGNSARIDDVDFSSRKIRAVATTGMIADIVKNVGGELGAQRVEVLSMMGPGVDPHLYKASEGDLHELEKADIIFYNGLHLEAGLARIFEHMSKWKRVIAVTQQVDRSKLHAPPEFGGNYDPHVWFDVSMWQSATNQVRDSLIAMDPDGAQAYMESAERYQEQLAELDSYIRQQVQRVPAEQRVLITAHDAFNYFGRAYGFQVRGLQGISTASEAGTGDLQALADFIASKRIRAVFVESSIPRRNIEAVQAAVRARGFEVKIGGQLYSDAMGDLNTPDGTYTGMLRHNIDTIVNALLEE